MGQQENKEKEIINAITKVEKEKLARVLLHSISGIVRDGVQ